MALEVSVSGGAQIKALADRMLRESRRDLTKEMGRALTRTVAPVKKSIAQSASATMPSSGGYRSLLTKSLRFRTSQRRSGQSAQVILRTFADGQSERRDIRSLEAGKLRHPVWGRSRPGARKGERVGNPWAVTSIRAGFHKRGTDGALDDMTNRLDEVVRDFTARLIK